MSEPDGFTLLEVVVAITVLAIGLMASALFMSHGYQFSVRSRFMAEAAQLCSEKLEDLNRFPQIDPNVTVMPGDNECGITGENCEGSLTADALPQTITVSGKTYTVYYSDAVYISVTNLSGSGNNIANGSFQETYQTAGVTNSSTNASYTTLTFSPNGLTPVPTVSTTPPTQGETFDRRWVIEQDQPVVGVRRVTVLVTLMYTSFLGLKKNVTSPITFQMSLVRP
jgi:prepilin-type N-terminal cleavage/methylation domain-containing protein